MADLYLSRKLASASSPISSAGEPNWYLTSPTIGSKISRASRASLATVRVDENDVEELEMLLEVGYNCTDVFIYSIFHSNLKSKNTRFDIFTGILHANRQHFEQINNGNFLSPLSFCSFPQTFWLLKTVFPILNTCSYVSISMTRRITLTSR